jgi:hypothetical protein
MLKKKKKKKIGGDSGDAYLESGRVILAVDKAYKKCVIC